MLKTELSEKYKAYISGVLGCYDRLIFTGTLIQGCYGEGMQYHLSKLGIRVFDYKKYAKGINEMIRKTITDLSKQSGIVIQHLRHKKIRKDKEVKKLLEVRGEHAGLVAIFSTMERCSVRFEPRYNPKTKTCSLQASGGKCTHYYIYFIDKDYGLCHLRIPTWLPCALQFYCNGHSYLAKQLDKTGINYKKEGNVFLQIGDWNKAQQLSDGLCPMHLLCKIMHYTRLYCPLHEEFDKGYQWSISQAEYACDYCFKRRLTLQGIYSELIKTAIHTVTPDNIATFLGKKKLHGNYQGELGSRLATRIQGTCIKHSKDKQSVKMYDKEGIVLRIEATTYDVRFFKHYREVNKRDGSVVMKYTNMRKHLLSLIPLAQILQGITERYANFLASLETSHKGKKRLVKVTKSVKHNQKSYRGINFFKLDDVKLLVSIAKGRFNIDGFRNKDIRKLVDKSSHQVSRLFKNLRMHGIIRKCGNQHKYSLTQLGKRVIFTGLKVKEFLITPCLNY